MNMKFSHVNIVVNNVIETRQFYEKYFNMKCTIDIGEQFASLRDSEGFLFNIMYGQRIDYPENYHIGFIQDSEESVDLLYQRLLKDGYNPGNPEFTHNSYTFFFKSPGDFYVEIYFDMSLKQ
ncbi:VOC family protein [Sulfitobacter donghicola]|nr:VOC family protein [Staphylococcus sp. B2-b]PMB94932.1 VOC family protein [Staphylococcus sp. UMB0328]PXX86311.1 VOC family protein [Staphylococcus warneri]QAV31452.1 VOC family protein [Sulfitobacter donghicola]